MNQTAKGRSTVFSTQGSRRLLDSVTSVFGAKQKDALTPLRFECPDDVEVEGLISKASAGCGMSSGDRQFIFLNKRPVDVPKLTKALNEVFRQFNMHQYPVYFLNIAMPTDAYDVNITPDKRSIMFHNEKAMVEAVKEQLLRKYEPSRGVLSNGAEAFGPRGRGAAAARQTAEGRGAAGAGDDEDGEADGGRSGPEADDAADAVQAVAPRAERSARGQGTAAATPRSPGLAASGGTDGRDGGGRVGRGAERGLLSLEDMLAGSARGGSSQERGRRQATLPFKRAVAAEDETAEEEGEEEEEGEGEEEEEKEVEMEEATESGAGASEEGEQARRGRVRKRITPAEEEDGDVVIEDTTADATEEHRARKRLQPARADAYDDASVYEDATVEVMEEDAGAAAEAASHGCEAPSGTAAGRRRERKAHEGDSETEGGAAFSESGAGAVGSAGAGSEALVDDLRDGEESGRAGAEVEEVEEEIGGGRAAGPPPLPFPSY